MVLARQDGLGPTRFGRRIACLRREFERNPDRPPFEMAQTYCESLRARLSGSFFVAEAQASEADSFCVNLEFERMYARKKGKVRNI